MGVEGPSCQVRALGQVYTQLNTKTHTNTERPQILRGLYSFWLRDWLALWPADKVLLLLAEDWYESPRESLARVTSFLGLPGDVTNDANLWAALHGAETHRPPNGSMRAPLPEAAALVDAFYAAHNEELGEMLGLGERVSPWAARRRPWRPAAAAAPAPAAVPAAAPAAVLAAAPEKQGQQAAAAAAPAAAADPIGALQQQHSIEQQT